MGSVSITISPSPGMSGEKITITTAGLLEGHVLTLTWDDPDLEPKTVKVGADGTIDLIVPKTAITLVVADPDSGTEAATVFG